VAENCDESNAGRQVGLGGSKIDGGRRRLVAYVVDTTATSRTSKQDKIDNAKPAYAEGIQTRGVVDVD